MGWEADSDSGTVAPQAGPLAGDKDRHLPLELEDGAQDQGLAQEQTGVVGQILGWEVVTAVNDDVVIGGNPQRVL